MTFADIVARVQDRLNLTSSTSVTRIGQSVNEGYREIASAVGVSTIQRATASATTAISNRSLVFGPTPIPVEKILSVYNPAFSPPQVLSEVDFDSLRNDTLGTDPPDRYAIQLMGSNTVTIFLSSSPATQYVLTADVLSNITDLSGTQVPVFTEDFHNILIYKGLQIELEKMEKYDLASKQEKKYQTRLEQYQYYIAKSAYLNVVQGLNSPEQVFRTTPLV